MKNLAKNTTHDSQILNDDNFSEHKNRYKFHFLLRGNPTSGFNLLKLAAFVSRNSPTEYTTVSIDDGKTVVFWNP